MKLLVTRPREDGLATAAALHKLRVKAILEPLYKLDQVSDVPELGGPYQGLLFTSRNGAKAFARLFGIPDLPCFCVGDSTAQIARELGFRPVYSAQGNSDDLVALILQHCPANEGPLFRAAGDYDDDSLTDTLLTHKYTIDARILYNAVPVNRLQRSTVMTLAKGFMDGVTFFSPAAAHHFKDLMLQERLDACCARMQAFCISEATAAKLDGLMWQAVHIAASPTHDALLQSIADAVPVYSQTTQSTVTSGEGN